MLKKYFQEKKIKNKIGDLNHVFVMMWGENPIDCNKTIKIGAGNKIRFIASNILRDRSSL